MVLTRDTIQELISKLKNQPPDPESLIKFARGLIHQRTESKIIHAFLDLGHLPQVNEAIADSQGIEEWLVLVLNLIEKSNYSFGHLFYNRLRFYKDKILFQEFQQGKVVFHSYLSVWEKLIQIAGALMTVEEFQHDPLRVGILTPNSSRGAMLDLSCLSFHFPVIPIPANATDQDIKYIINHSRISHVFIGGEKRTHWQQLLESIPVHIVDIDSDDWTNLLASAAKEYPRKILQRIGRVDLNAIATIMYTSGTTGEPKGITFTQKQMIIKRFARALALPGVGNEDIFLSYLPLYHTFGRFLELQGAIFWGATYAFTEDPSYKTIRKNFLIVKPSIFISIPKRWMQIYETATTLLHDRDDDDKFAQRAIRKVTGGKLKWGLSAAGYLDPDIFHFFQKHGLNLLSGYGMTEATGGITMTPPNDFITDSVGTKLPGIDLKLSAEGELLIKGPYVSQNYYGNPLIPCLQNGWFHTGDIFRVDNGHYFITDRKKEIYKNAAGQTITPQKIENMLQEFDAIETAFLVGDRQDYNTVLIYPNQKFIAKHFPKMEPARIRSAVGALIQSVNGFLPNFERIVNFVLISRNFSVEKNELTQKGTFKRQNVLTNWAQVIEPMYATKHAEVYTGNKRIIFPNWLIKTLNITPQDINWTGCFLKIDVLQRKCKCIWKDNKLQLGDYQYQVADNRLDINRILFDPRLWLGNTILIDFIGDIIFQLSHFNHEQHISITDLMDPPRNSSAAIRGKPTLKTMHQATILMIQENEHGFNMFKELFASSQIQLKNIGITLLTGLLHLQRADFSRKLFDFLVPYLDGKRFISAFKVVFEKHHSIKKLPSFKIDENNIQPDQIDHILKALIGSRQHIDSKKLDYAFVRKLIQLAVNLVRPHPSYLALIRHEINMWTIYPTSEDICTQAENCLQEINDSLAVLISCTQVQSIDPKTGKETGWDTIVKFGENMSRTDQSFLLELLQSQPVIRAAIFILTGFRQVQLRDVKQNGIWVNKLNSKNGSRYRVLITLRDGNAYNIIIAHFPDLNKDQIEDIIHWQMVMSAGLESKNLTNNYITSFIAAKCIVSEYEHKSDVISYLQNHAKEITDVKLRDRWDMRWLHFGWSGIQGYINYLHLFDYKKTVAAPAMENVIVSEFDNATHIIITDSFITIPVTFIFETVNNLYQTLIIATEQRFQGLNHVLKWEIVFTSILQASGVEKGLAILKQLSLELPEKTTQGLNQKSLLEYIQDVQAYGFLPKPVVFAALRFQRWLDLNPRAELQAQYEILQELYTDYKLDEVQASYPWIRIRYFLLTCFRDHEALIANKLFTLCSELFHETTAETDLESKILTLANSPSCTEKDAYFLTRLIYHHVDPRDNAELVSRTSGDQKLDLIVNIQNKNGKKFTIRPPFKPKEIVHFHDLLLEFNLPSNFSDAHDFLLIFSAKERNCGGVFWKMTDNKTAHLEKIAIAESYQGQELGKLLLNEFINRLKQKSVRHVTVGFMKSEFFQKNEFTTDPAFPGLVKAL